MNRKIGLVVFGVMMMMTGCYAQPDPFEGMENSKVLPMLKNLPYEHGGWNIEATDGRYLYNLITENGYKSGLEVGTSNGYSTLWLGLAFKQTGGEIITIEINENRANEARKNFKKAGLDDVIDSRLNDALKEIPGLEGTFDFIFLDAAKSDYLEYLRMLKPMLEPGGAITAHNVINLQSGMKDFLDTIKNDPEFETEIVETSHHGISVSFYRK